MVRSRCTSVEPLADFACADEPRNREVTKLGVTFVLVPDGVHRQIFEAGIETWRKKQEST